MQEKLRTGFKDRNGTDIYVGDYIRGYHPTLKLAAGPVINDSGVLKKQCIRSVRIPLSAFNMQLIEIVDPKTYPNLY